MKKEIVQGKERILRTKQRKDTTTGGASLVAVWGNGGNGGTGRESERTSLTNFICGKYFEVHVLREKKFFRVEKETVEISTVTG